MPQILGARLDIAGQSRKGEGGEKEYTFLHWVFCHGNVKADNYDVTNRKH